MEAAPLSNPKHRFSDSTKWLPVAFVSSIIGGLYLIYMRYHVAPRLYVDDMRERAGWEMIVFNVVTMFLCICYVKCILVAPGTIPMKEEDPTWEYVPRYEEDGSLDTNLCPQEWKRTGDRRQCKWCAKYKPDRCHHCRVCRMCILKMDHHCPWIYNCVGFKNHKYFFLLLMYTAIDCNIIVWSMFGTVYMGLEPTTPFMVMFLLLFGETLAAFLGAVVTLFFGFHIYLTLRAMTTIEFCEKSMKKDGYDSNVYDRGCLGNIKAVLGENVWLWLLPLSLPSGNGLVFVTEDSWLLGRSAEAGASYATAADQSRQGRRF